MKNRTPVHSVTFADFTYFTSNPSKKFVGRYLFPSPSSFKKIKKRNCKELKLVVLNRNVFQIIRYLQKHIVNFKDKSNVYSNIDRVRPCLLKNTIYKTIITIRDNLNSS